MPRSLIARIEKINFGELKTANGGFLVLKNGKQRVVKGSGKPEKRPTFLLQVLALFEYGGADVTQVPEPLLNQEELSSLAYNKVVKRTLRNAAL